MHSSEGAGQPFKTRRIARACLQVRSYSQNSRSVLMKAYGSAEHGSSAVCTQMIRAYKLLADAVCNIVSLAPSKLIRLPDQMSLQVLGR